MWPFRRKHGRRSQRLPKHPVAAWAAKSLDMEPHTWGWTSTGTRYRIKHTSGVEVWVGNNAWGVHIDLPNQSQAFDRPEGKLGATSDQKLVWAAYRRWAEPHERYAAPINQFMIQWRKKRVNNHARWSPSPQHYLRRKP